ncbi:OmpP1/FadL family transporter [Yunchengibacter salinarum]|uniref:OmpP1/FadL family transporter n=1 Tax=Yunchengibacter salinarum TaxID=3133399 RepID=UPI0035B64725
MPSDRPFSLLRSAVLGLGLAGLASAGASATNGYFQHGYGVKAKAMGGASIAVIDGVLTTANNPAGMVHVGNRLELGVDWFAPDRGGRVMGQDFSANGKNNFILPEAGVNIMLDDDLSLGLTLFGNGGMNTSFEAPVFSSQFAGTDAGTNTGIDMAQLFVSPTLSYEMTEGHSIGVAFNLIFQYFEATGLANFCGFTENGFATPDGRIGCPQDPGAAIDGLTDQGTDWSTGTSVRIGYRGQFTDWLAVGAYYQTESQMQRFEKYENLFAENGDFDIPEHFGAGVALYPGGGTTIAADVQHIRYGSIASVGNPNTGFSAPAAFGLGPALGADTGPGFAWEGMTIFKIGVEQQVSRRLHLRAGFSHGNQPIPEGETTFNFIAPGVIENHATIGAEWTFDNGVDIQVFFMHAFEKSVQGSTPAGQFGPGSADIHMNQNSAGITFGFDF